MAGGQNVVGLLKRRFFYRRQAGIVHWVCDRRASKAVKIMLAGEYRARFTVRHRGVHRVRAIIEGTSAYRTVRTNYRLFRVR
jgi:hypothetical protein